MTQEDLGSECTHVHQWNLTEGVGHLFTPQDSLVLPDLALGCISCSHALDFFLCDFSAFLCPPCSAHSSVCLALHPKLWSKMFCTDMLASDLQR